MPYYERVYIVAVLACLVMGVLAVAQGNLTFATHDFIAVALSIRLDERLRRRWTLVDEDPGIGWQRLRTPGQ